MPKAIFNWSGGKDSALALYKVGRQKEFEVKYLLTTVNEHFQRVSMHGVRTALLRQQAQQIGIPLHPLLLPEMPSMEVYEQRMRATLNVFGEEEIRTSIFGDIFLEDLRVYRETQLGKLNWQAHFPLWKMPVKDLMSEFIDLGFKAVVVCVNNQFLDKSFAGRMIDRDFVKDLPAHVDICGENGEYHSFVFDGPIFIKPIPFTIGESIFRTYQAAGNCQVSSGNNGLHVPENPGFWYTDLIPVLP